ncbi:hypothetical protein SODALDRAFT_379840 [Sodiomyces alkalinus F11]|uniref:GPI anchored protein n=1 Tax=Sodiomyces alkalinus (strain CBS 110278 / VKM F-3762 / F11) TaxID=1314773 RepID=A0A3N2PSB9_SODAK|nr:hypothetical protein SODALDRAFT_379840 [Sodiomyces alkalinus F11]ROT37370.1 hypothetical protein SODALDRAFT_379840 [Sodiomyces alkalinus F11]
MGRLLAVLVFALWAAVCPSRANQIPQLAMGLGLSTIDSSEAQLSDLLVPETSANSSVVSSEDLDGNELGLVALMPRQRQCVNPGHYICADGVRCCPNGDTCVSVGCCRGNTRLCSANSCYDPSSEKCCSDYIVCPSGWDCVGGGCCPSGQRRCGNSKCYNPNTQTCCTGPGTVWACTRSQACCPNGYCRNPNTEQCCQGGTCDNDTTCCRYECCRSIGYCGSDGYCKPCPPATRTVTSTWSSTTTLFRTVTITRDPAPETEDAPEFTCIPMTATNIEGATLELAEDCGLQYNPPASPTTTPAAAAAAAAIRARDSNPDPTIAAANPLLLPRQANCVPFTTQTTTMWVTQPFTTTQTRSRTIRGPGDDEGFSCPEMEATNAVGDVLAMDASCALSFSPGTPTTPTTPTTPPAGPTVADQGPGPLDPGSGAGSLWSSFSTVRHSVVVAVCVVYVLL